MVVITNIEGSNTHLYGSGESCRLGWLKEGATDSGGRQVEQIVYVDQEKYVLYFVKNDYLKAYYIQDYTFEANFSNAFQQALLEIRSYNVKNEKKNEFIRQTIASAYFNVLNGYENVALRELESLGNKLFYQLYVWWIITYMIGCMLMIVTCVILPFISHYTRLNELIYCMTSSCVGSLLVYSQKEKTAMTRHYLPVINAIIRFLSSVISGFLVYCILKSNLLLGTFSESIFGIILVCFIAGYSEDVPLKLLSGISGMIVSQKEKE